MMADDGVAPHRWTPGVLRAVQAEIAARQRVQIRDLLMAACLDAERYPVGPSHTRRLGYGLRAAVELLDGVDPQPGQLWSQIFGDDGVEVWYDDPPGPDVEILPVRIVVTDSAELVTATAYLSLEDAELHATEVLQLVAKLRQERADRATAVAQPEVPLAGEGSLAGAVPAVPVTSGG